MQWSVAIGVDTHKDAHVAVACDSLGRQLGSVRMSASAAGYLGLLEWAQALGRPAFAIEGSGSYGAGLARFLVAAGAGGFEGGRPPRRGRPPGQRGLIDAGGRGGRARARGGGGPAPRGGGGGVW